MRARLRTVPRRDLAPSGTSGRESGQMLVEFGIILAPLLLLVGGIIYLGIGLNYWLDLQRIASQGARHAVVDHWPTCSRWTAKTPAPHPVDGCTTTLQRYIACQPVPDALKPTVSISFPGGSAARKRDDSVEVSVSSPFKVIPLVGLGTITLTGKATMRIEQDATHHTDADTYTPGACP